jgi:cation diffusion facilitator CzcD-associated flavoprotein CzcO
MPSIAIIGTGFAGIGLAISLKQRGINSFNLYERAAAVGGVWRDNTYPGAACDIPSHLYSFSFEHQYPWSRRYAPQSEILAYLKHCIDKYEICPHISLNNEITGAEFQESRGVWALSSGEKTIAEVQILVSAIGQFSNPVVPNFPGRDSFSGQQIHSARWDHSFCVDGKNVAVIGTGASVIQIVPEIAGRARRLTIFQRSAPYVFPKGPDRFTAKEAEVLTRFPVLRTLHRLKIYASYEARIPRRKSEKLIAKSEHVFRNLLQKQISDPSLREDLTPDHRWGCKRVLLSNDWYRTLSRQNVAIVKEPIEKILSEGVRTLDGATHVADAIIYGTGFAPSDFLRGLKIKGLGGEEIGKAWNDGAEAYLGITVAGFPNFFLMFGPNTNIPGSVIYMIESQVRYIVRMVEAFDRSKVRYMNVRADVQKRFNQRLQSHLRRTVWATGNCSNWFMAASGKITTQWPGFLFSYRRLTRRPRRRDYTSV